MRVHEASAWSVRRSASTLPLMCRKPPCEMPATRSRSSGSSRSPRGRYTRATSKSATSSLPRSALRLATSTREGRSSVRSTASSTVIGSCSGSAPAARSCSTRDGVYTSEKPSADERVLDAAAHALCGGEAPGHLTANGKRERDLGEVEARDFLHEVDLPGEVASAPGGNDVLASRAVRYRGG